MPYTELPRTLGALKNSDFAAKLSPDRTLKEELRSNLICKLERGDTLFPGVMGYEDTVVPQVVNAVLSRHNFILLGLRGQAKTRLARMLTRLLDDQIPYVAGCEIRDHPLRPICRQCRDKIAAMGDETPINWLKADDRYVEKLATPDVTIADMIGDIDPIKAARAGQDISNELTIHYGLVPRANRCLFVLNELPDLAGKVQVGLFNIMQEGDVQIKGYPVRLPLDVMLVFTANPEDYTARGKIITPLKDRIGSEIRTHYPLTVDHGIAITRQEAWTRRQSPVAMEIPPYIHEVVEHIAFLARDDKRIDKKSGKESCETRLFITSLEPAPKTILDAVRSHWGIENSLHWTLDVIFDEDRCKTRKDNSPLGLAIIRHAAFNILKADKTKGSLRRKRIRACIDTAFRSNLFAA